MVYFPHDRERTAKKDHPDEFREKILQEYFNVMLFRDLIERYKITQASLLKYFCKRLIGASGCEISIHKIFNELKSQGYQISKNTLYAYQEYTESIYLHKLVPRYSLSVLKTEHARKKTYSIDPGMGSAIDYKLSRDYGRLLETTVALEFIKRGEHIAYDQNGSECDFVITRRGEATEAIQASIDISDSAVKAREIRGLTKTCNKFGLKSGAILTMDQEETFEHDGINIYVLPAWRYFSGTFSTSAPTPTS
ncbi:MAG: DUF4143 domain-containing protein [Synergistaceae bacterium]|jgi:predicted AAA+ superfamily ATPase|nr:DUF4143 domain-containing protein [Synergistaceae bacterium]